MHETANSSFVGQAHSPVSGRHRAHISGVAMEPKTDASKELAALFKRADLVTAMARRRVNEYDRWRQAILQKFDHMFEIGTFRKSRPR
jgi:hypothetical protein